MQNFAGGHGGANRSLRPTSLHNIYTYQMHLHPLCLPFLCLLPKDIIVISGEIPFNTLPKDNNKQGKKKSFPMICPSSDGSTSSTTNFELVSIEHFMPPYIAHMLRGYPAPKQLPQCHTATVQIKYFS